MSIKKLICLILSFSLIISLASGCKMINSADSYELLNGSDTVKAAGEDIIKLQNVDEKYVEGLNSFAYEMYYTLRKEEEGNNIFISPYSIFMALSMLYNCTDGDTRSELAAVLGFDKLEAYTPNYSKESNKYVNSNALFMLKKLQDMDKKVELSIANSIWLSKDIRFNSTIEEAVLSPVRDYYNADIYKADFTLEETLKRINSWVSDNTNKMIPILFEDQRDIIDSRMLLVNAIYFDGEWLKTFDAADTTKDEFHGITATNIIDMMHMYNNDFRYIVVDGIRGLQMPYNGGGVVMDIFIPEDPDNNNISTLLNGLSKEEFSDLIKMFDRSLYTEINNLAMPKFKMDYTVDLNNVLREIGMNEAFDMSAANLDLAGDELYVDDVCHKAVLEVDEKGTKAAAVSAVIVTDTEAPLNEDPMINFIVDIPFMLIIRDQFTNTILFMGEMNDIR